MIHRIYTLVCAFLLGVSVVCGLGLAVRIYSPLLMPFVAILAVMGAIAYLFPKLQKFALVGFLAITLGVILAWM